jgi:hypothetical protein
MAGCSGGSNPILTSTRDEVNVLDGVDPLDEDGMKRRIGARDKAIRNLTRDIGLELPDGKVGRPPNPDRQDEPAGRDQPN